MLSGNIPIKFNKGEAYLYQIEFDSDSYTYVTDVYISCNKLNFCHHLTNDNENQNRWYYLFDEEETSKFLPTDTTYTLTVNNSIEELNPQKLVNQPFIIIDDKNILECGSN